MSLRSVDWALCRSFLAILRDGSLSGAARTLGVAHPTMRRHLEDLEAGLGAPLFVRSPTGLAPTELALALREAAEAMESAFDRMIRQASGTGDALAGTVRIAASEVMGVEVLPAILARLGAARPALTFELDVSDDLADLLRRDADIAVRMTRPTQSELTGRRVANLALGLFAHRSWLDAHGPPASLDALLGARHLIGYDRGTALIAELGRRGVAAERRDFGFRSDSGLAQLAALRAGLGVAVCQVALAARDRRLVRVLPEIAEELEVWVVSHPNLRGSRRVRACLDALADGIAAYAAGRGD